MMNHDKQALANRVAEALEGTCMTLLEALNDHDAEHLEDDAEFALLLDDNVFCCEGCNWWYHIGEVNDGTGQLLCDDCTGALDDAD